MTAAPPDLVDLVSADASAATASVIREILALTEGGDVLSLAGGMPAPATFPVRDLAEAAARVLDEHGPQALQYARTDGITALRTVLAARIATARDRECTPDEVVITTGSQQALDLIGATFLDPGDEVAIEAPGYLGAIQAFARRTPTWLPVAVDADGLDTDALARALRDGHRPKLVYTATDFQNPTGAVLHPQRRRHLAALAETYGFLIVEDDPYGALRFGTPVHAPIAAHTQRCISLGTVSKTIAPGLRIGWAAAPPPIATLLARTKQAVDLHTSSFDQHLVLDLLSRPGWFAARAATLADFYRTKATVLVDALADAVPGLVTARPRGGLFLWGRLAGRDTTALLPEAVAGGVAFVPGAAFCTTSATSDHLRLSFATLDDDDLVRAARRLGAVVGST